MVRESDAEPLVEAALEQLAVPGGVAASGRASRGTVAEDDQLRQWDWPFGWAPHQMIAWRGLRRYDMQDRASALAYRWLYTVLVNATRYNSAVTEKYDLVERRFDVDVAYGN
ncbi:MAG: trehalase family glycosidase, partial [Bradymonadaceae bacterium]